MSTWHVHSTIGRNRLLAGDVSRAVEGIAISLKRDFHISVSKTDSQDRAPVSPRSKRLAVAADEVSSLSPPPRLVDARSLAATPQTRFRITQVEPSVRGVTRGRGGLRGRDGRIGGTAGTSGGRGHGGGRAGRAPDLRRRRGKAKNPHYLDDPNEPDTPEVQAYMDRMEMGVEAPYEAGMTVKEALKLEFPPLATDSVPEGLISTIRDRMKALTGQHGNELDSPQEHAKRYLKGNGTLFLNDEDLARATSVAPHSYKTLDEADRQDILQTLVAGKYQALKEPKVGDILGTLDTYGLKNETYLPKDREILKARILELFKATPQPKQAKRS